MLLFDISIGNTRPSLCLFQDMIRHAEKHSTGQCTTRYSVGRDTVTYDN